MPTKPPTIARTARIQQHAGHAPRRFVRIVRLDVMAVRFVGVRVAVIEMRLRRDQVVAGVLRLRLRMPFDVRGAVVAGEGHEVEAEHVEGGEAAATMPSEPEEAVVLEGRWPRISSFEKKPASGGMPAMAMQRDQHRHARLRHVLAAGRPSCACPARRRMPWITRAGAEEEAGLEEGVGHRRGRSPR